MTTLSPALGRTRSDRNSRSASVELPIERPGAAVVDVQKNVSALLPVAQLAGFLGLAGVAGVRAAMHPASFLSVLLAGVACALIVAGFEVAGRSTGVGEDF